jgi:Ras-related protein Rab-11A
MKIGDNNLSFIETSALDASNVELAFQNILTGISLLSIFSLRANNLSLEIYRIVSSQALHQAENAGGIPQGEKIQITQTSNTDSKQGQKCC